MTDHKSTVQNAEGVRGTDINGNVVVLTKTHPEQLVLFQTFLSDEDDNGHGDEKYSNTIELYDAVPKYFSNPRLMDRMRKDGKYLPMLERPFKHRGEMYTVKIWPARLEDRQGGEKHYYSGPREELVEEALQQAERGLVGSMEGHAEMDMAVAEGTLRQRITSPRGFTVISHYFVMDWAAIWRDIAGGLLIAGALMAWVPTSFWQSFFLVNHPVAAYFWGPIVGPIVAMLSFVCSIGNVPLAAVLWNGGISFGGVISFIFADLIVLPILNIYRKYYGVRMMLFLLATSYAAMVAAGLIVELAFMGVGLVPRERAAEIVEPHVTLNYTTVLNIVFLALAAILLVRFFRTNGLAMLRMMNRPPAGGEHAGHGEHGHGVHANEGSSMAADPVCGMQVKTDRATATAEFGGKTYYFCSTACRDRFQKNPERYTRQTA